jgi:hypothetical protein
VTRISGGSRKYLKRRISSPFVTTKITKTKGLAWIKYLKFSKFSISKSFQKTPKNLEGLASVQDVSTFLHHRPAAPHDLYPIIHGEFL